MDPFGEASDLKDDFVPKNKKKSTFLSKNLALIITLIIIILIFTGIVLSLFLTRKPIIVKKMICTYRINDCSTKIPILNKEYNKESLVKMLINDNGNETQETVEED